MTDREMTAEQALEMAVAELKSALPGVEIV